jgi:hypothetical protein
VPLYFMDKLVMPYAHLILFFAAKIKAKFGGAGNH